MITNNSKIKIKKSWIFKEIVVVSELNEEITESRKISLTLIVTPEPVQQVSKKYDFCKTQYSEFSREMQGH